MMTDEISSLLNNISTKYLTLTYFRWKFITRIVTKKKMLLKINVSTYKLCTCLYADTIPTNKTSYESIICQNRIYFKKTSTLCKVGNFIT